MFGIPDIIIGFFKGIGAPLFVLGVLLAIGFVGGNVLFFILFMVLGYYFIKGTIFSSPYSKSIKTQVSNVSNNNFASLGNNNN